MSKRPLFMTPTKSQLNTRQEDIAAIKTFVFTKVDAHQINSGRVSEISLIAMHKQGLSWMKSPTSMPRIVDRLLLSVNPCSPIENHLCSVSDVEKDDAKNSQRNVFDDELVCAISGFLNHQKPPVCLVSHNGFRHDYQILQFEFKKIDRNIGKMIFDNLNSFDLLCADSLWTFKEMDNKAKKTDGNKKFAIQKDGASILDMVYYTMGSLYNRYLDKNLPESLSTEKRNECLIELVSSNWTSFLNSFCCKKLSEVPALSIHKNDIVEPVLNERERNNDEIQTLVFLDLETNGLKFPIKITELCLIALDKNVLKTCPVNRVPRIKDKLTLVIDPDATIEQAASQLSDLDNATISAHEKQKFTVKTALLIANFLQRQPQPVCLVAHNGDNFDFNVLKEHISKNVSSVFSDIYAADTIHGLRSLDGKDQNGRINSQKLGMVYSRWFPSYPIADAHQAEVDVFMLIKIAQAVPGLIDWIDAKRKHFML